jgi:hypothetical protein
MVKAETGQNAIAIGISLLMASNFLRGRLQTLQEVMGHTFITEDKISAIHMSQIGKRVLLEIIGSNLVECPGSCQTEERKYKEQAS